MSERDRSGCHRKGEIITTAIVWLLLGAIVNVAVAWGIAVFVIHPQSNNVLDPDLDYFIGMDAVGNPRWYIMGWRRVGCLQIFSEKAGADEALVFACLRNQDSRDGKLPSWSRIQKPPREAGPLIEDARGWPLLALRSAHHCTRFSSATQEVTFGLRLAPATAGNGPFSWLSPRALPLCPIISGFAINTTFYAAILWLLFAAPGKVRRWRRIKRGLCPACAYPVGESATCTECGKPIRILL